MSNFYRDTKHPKTGVIEQALWIDGYFGAHEYGIKFLDGEVFSVVEIRNAEEKEKCSNTNSKK